MAGEAARLLPPVLLVLLASGSWEQRTEFLHATEGETISVTCKYRSWEDFSREKIWCRWTSAPECTRLVSTSRWPLVAQETRYVIRDNQLSGTFTVTMTKLRKTDSGSYSCVIKSWSSQSILKIIHLTVSPASTLPATTSRATTTARASTISPAVDSGQWTAGSCKAVPCFKQAVLVDGAERVSQSCLFPALTLDNPRHSAESLLWYKKADPWVPPLTQDSVLRRIY